MIEPKVSVFLMFFEHFLWVDCISCGCWVISAQHVSDLHTWHVPIWSLWCFADLILFFFIQKIHEVMKKPNINPKVRNILEQMRAFDNIPRKKVKFQVCFNRHLQQSMQSA